MKQTRFFPIKYSQALDQEQYNRTLSNLESKKQNFIKINGFTTKQIIIKAFQIGINLSKSVKIFSLCKKATIFVLEKY